VNDLVAWLTRLGEQALGTVVHVGAGAGAVLQRYAALPASLQPRQVVLIEGDPEVAPRLERAAAPHPWARVVPAAVGAVAGPMPWNRYNLPMLNGPLDAEGAKSVYPRLRRVQTTTLRCEALADVLEALSLQPAAKDPCVHALLLDVPGQEASLLAALSPQVLRPFHAVLLRGCRAVLPPSGQAAKAAPALLAKQHFAPVAQDDERNTMWPVALLRFDPVAHELVQLRQQASEMAAALKERDREVAALQKDSGVLGQARANADKLAAEHLGKSLEQEDTIRQLEAQLSEATTRLELLQQEVTKAEGQLALMKELLLKEPSS
jgi:FkbM family methyltransferase